MGVQRYAVRPVRVDSEGPADLLPDPSRLHCVFLCTDVSLRAVRRYVEELLSSGREMKTQLAEVEVIVPC